MDLLNLSPLSVTFRYLGAQQCSTPRHALAGGSVVVRDSIVTAVTTNHTAPQSVVLTLISAHTVRQGLNKKRRGQIEDPRDSYLGLLHYMRSIFTFRPPPRLACSSLLWHWCQAKSRSFTSLG